MKEKFNRVFVIGLDGAGNFIKDTETPNIHNLLGRGAITYNAQAVYPSISGECWGSLLHGVLPEKHQLTNEVVEGKKFPADSIYPSFFRLIREKWEECKIAAFSCWTPINYGIIEDNIECHKVSMPDEELAQGAAKYIIENPDLKALFLQFDLPDAAGHKHGYGTDDYLKAVSKTDENVGIVLDAIKEAGLLDDSLIIITSDHGGGGDAGFYTHGSNHPKDMTVFWGCYGIDIVPNIELENITIMDTAAVVAAALGITKPETWDANVPESLLEVLNK